MAVFPLTIFLSAFLLFSVQPLMGRYVLPWFGGSPAVWTTCMLFFQACLFFGYAYAHWLAGRRRRPQLWGHLVLLAVSLAFLPLAPSFDLLERFAVDSPPGRVTILLAGSIGLPFLALAATSPLLQAWFNRADETRSPYRLYAVSNAGSLLALMCYPLVLEPTLTLRQQGLVWSGAYLLFAAACAVCAFRTFAASSPLPASPVPPPPAPSERSRTPTGFSLTFWLLLSSLGSVMLLATTNQLCQEVASVPFLWTFPLAIYLATFILTFESERWYRRLFWGAALALIVPPVWWTFYQGPGLGFATQAILYCAALFVACMVCHGELHALRPAPRHLTLFYLAISLGGALGGLFVTFLAPALFQSYREYELALLGICLSTLILWTVKGLWRLDLRHPLFWLVPALTAYVLALPVVVFRGPPAEAGQVLEKQRNFYGILQVVADRNDNGPFRTLINGRVAHGTQYLAAAKRRQPASYFAEGSPVSLAFASLRADDGALPDRRLLRVGVIGTGIGTISSYGRRGDYFRFYEINPAVIELARRHFTYLEESPARIDVVIGDGRIVLERELRRDGPHRFDLLILDAFTSDAIPLHLLTRESFTTYLDHLRPQGLLLAHISNRFVDLSPVIRGLAREADLKALRLEAGSDGAALLSASSWMAVTADESLARRMETYPGFIPWRQGDRPPLVFTDDFLSLIKILKI